MDRIQAKEKINKLLRLANDKGATESERETALDMANKLASKFSFKIQRGTPSQHSQETFTRPVVEKFCYEFYLNCFNKKFVSFLLGFFGIKNWAMSGKNSVLFISYIKFNVDEFKKFSKKFVSVYYKTKKLYGCSEPDFFWYFTASFSSGYRHFQEDTVSFIAAYDLGKEFFDKKNTIAY